MLTRIRLSSLSSIPFSGVNGVVEAKQERSRERSGFDRRRGESCLSLADQFGCGVETGSQACILVCPSSTATQCAAYRMAVVTVVTTTRTASVCPSSVTSDVIVHVYVRNLRNMKEHTAWRRERRMLGTSPNLHSLHLWNGWNSDVCNMYRYLYM